MKSEAEVGVMQLQTKGRKESPGGVGRTDHGFADTLVLDFSPPELSEKAFVVVSCSSL